MTNKKTYLAYEDLSKKRQETVDVLLSLDKQRVKLIEKANAKKDEESVFATAVLDFLNKTHIDGVKVGKEFLLYPSASSPAPSFGDVLAKVKKSVSKAVIKALEEAYEVCKKEKRKNSKPYLAIKKARKIDQK